MPSVPDLLTVDEIAERLRVEVSTIRTWARTGRIPVRRFTPKVYRYCLADVVAALEAGAKLEECEL
jgi:excisionase family DNA binding protein